MPAARRPPDVAPNVDETLAGQSLSHEFATALLRRHRGNFRNALAECYDRCATGSLPTPPAIRLLGTDGGT